MPLIQNVPAVIEEKSSPQSLLSLLPMNPRPTLTSLARMVQVIDSKLTFVLRNFHYRIAMQQS